MRKWIHGEIISLLFRHGRLRGKRRRDAINRDDRHLSRDPPQKSATRFPHARLLEPRNVAAY